MHKLVQELLSHYGELRRHLLKELKDPHQAADVAQSSFERVYVHALKTQGEAESSTKQTIESPKALLFRVARNLCIDEARRRKTAIDWADHRSGVDAARTQPSSEYVVAQRRVLLRVVETLEALPARRREVFVLFRAHGCTRAEIAARLGITEMAVAKHMLRATIDCSRALAELRDELVQPEVADPQRRGFDPRMAEDFA
jgi:RNA polymerase sigma-70 factor (ECF subfamily)